MASFIVLLAIVAHRFLRLDLISERVAAVHLPSLLTGLLGVAIVVDAWRGRIRLRPQALLLVQWGLCAWAAICKVVADGTSALRDFAGGNYLKDVIFLTLVGVLTDSMARLRQLIWVFVVVMTVVAAVVIPQHSGDRRCYYYDYGKNAGLNYIQQTDNRSCMAASDCYELPPGEQHLRSMSWACEREGVWGMATVLERVRYVGSMVEPNAMSLALVMSCALALGLATWPGRRRPGSRGLLRLLVLLAAGAMMLAIVYAASRAGQAALGLMVVCFAALRIGPWTILLALPAAVPLALLTSRNAAEAAYSTATRTQTLLNGYNAFLDRPLFGVGLDNYGRISFLNAHNSFILAATETGVVGIGLFILGVYLALKFLFKVWRWPQLEEEADAGDDADDTDEGEDGDRGPGELTELRHMSVTLTAMLVGVCSCITFESLSFDVMWLFPVGVLAAFYRIVQEQLPEFELNVHLYEIVGALLIGGLLPPVMVFVTTSILY